MGVIVTRHFAANEMKISVLNRAKASILQSTNLHLEMDVVILKPRLHSEKVEKWVTYEGISIREKVKNASKKFSFAVTDVREK